MVEGEQKRIDLGFSFVVAGSETLMVRGRVLPRDSYLVDYRRGTVILARPFTERTILRVSYVRYPFLLSPSYSLRKAEFSKGGSSGPATAKTLGRQESAVRPRPLSRLTFGGTKSVSFSLGTNQGVSLSQVLKATVAGEISEGVEVRAMLSDDNLPIQPEGNTEELEYLDKVFIEVSSSRARAALGDITLANDYSSFSSFRREVKGVSASAKLGGAEVSLSGATSKGLFRTVSFRGREGLQGPYELLPAVRFTGQVIIAGSEKVYLDGELLRRGQNRDYVIDYDRGTITFTPRRLITPDSEIAVDFEVSAEDYQRTSLLMGLKGGFPGGVEGRFVFARERDDPDRSKRAALSEEDRAALATAGDRQDLAHSSGVSYVGVGKGEYRYVPADSLTGVPAHYEFDDSLGAYQVAFVRQRGGGYTIERLSPRGRPVYRFLGPGAGEYGVGKELSLPETKSLVALRLIRSRGEHITFDCEYDVSDYDKNVLSSLDDGDNLGTAGAVKLSVAGLGLSSWKLGVAGSWNFIDDRFASLDKPRPSYFYRNWNLEGIAQKGRESIGELSATLSRSSLGLTYTLGRLSRGSYVGGRHRFLLSYGGEQDRRARLRLFRTRMEGQGENRWRRYGGLETRYRFRWFTPFVSLAKEDYLKRSTAPGDSGYAYNRLRLGFSLGSDRSGVEVYFEDRLTRALADTTAGWVESRDDKTLALSLRSHGGGRVRGELELIHRVEDSPLQGGRFSSDLARLKATLRVPSLALRTDVDYEISSSQVRSTRRSVVFVGTGKGDYNSLGDPVGKGRGDYMLVFLPGEDLVPARKVNMTLRFLLGEGASGRGFFSRLAEHVSLDQTFTVKEESTFPQAWKIYLLFPSALQRNATTLYGISSLRQDWTLFKSRRNLSMVFRYQRRDEEENRFLGQNEDVFFGEHALRVDRGLSRKLGLGVELRREIKRRLAAGGASTGGSYRGISWMGTGRVSLQVGAGTTLEGEFELADRRDRLSRTGERTLSLRPRIVARVVNTLSLFGSYQFNYSRDRGGGVRPLFFLGPGDSHRWNLTVNWRIAAMITLVATYGGRNERAYSGERITEHNLRVETRAYF